MAPTPALTPSHVLKKTATSGMAAAASGEKGVAPIPLPVIKPFEKQVMMMSSLAMIQHPPARKSKDDDDDDDDDKKSRLSGSRLALRMPLQKCKGKCMFRTSGGACFQDYLCASRNL